MKDDDNNTDEELEDDEDFDVDGVMADNGVQGGKLRKGPFDPAGCAQEFIAEWMGERLTWRENFFGYTGTHWKIENHMDVMAMVNRELMDSVWERWDKKKDMMVKVPWTLNNAALANLEKQLMLQASLHSTVEPARGGDYVFLENGRLNIMTETLYPHDPSIFNLHAVPFDYDPLAHCPEWDKFMDTTFGGDEVAIEIHYRWMAAELIGAVDMQKAYMLLGERRSGKGTLMRIGDALAGHGQTTAMSLRDFSKGFGLYSLIGKTVCRINELVDAGPGAGAAVEYLLNIIGGDTIQVDRKNKDPWIGQMPVLFTLTGNEIPRMPDSGGALISRLIVNRTVGSREGMQDPNLSARIIKREMPGVLNRVLVYVDKVNDKWPVNELVLDDIEMLRDGGSPVRAWLNDVGMKFGPTYGIERKEAFAEFTSWAHENGHGRLTSQWFGRHLKPAVPRLATTHKRIEGKQVRYYSGFGREELFDWTP